jgi:hypothetical protein
MLRGIVETCWFASVTWTVKLLVPTTGETPEIIPVEGSRVKPDGSEPALRDQIYGCLPPLAVRVELYGKYATPLGNEAAAMESGAYAGCPSRVAA